MLERRTRNRALLARQMLLERATCPVAEALGHLVGLQAQNPRSPYLALWSRLEGFEPGQLSSLIATRRAVRVALMRGTIHLVNADDCLALRPFVQPVMDRDLRTNHQYTAGLAGIDLPAVAAAARALLDDNPLIPADLGERLAEQWPDRPPASLAHAARGLLPLVQVPPRGLWDGRGRAMHTTAEAWLGRPLDPTASPDDVVLRYLAAFGPASVMDVQAWSGLTRLREVVERLRPQLRTFRDEDGRELFDLPDAPLPPGDTPAPPRFLPDYDNLTLSHADRTHVISAATRRRLMTRNGVPPGSVLVDGVVSGSWRLDTAEGATALVVTPFARVSAGDRAALAQDGARLAMLLAPAVERREVRFDSAD